MTPNFKANSLARPARSRVRSVSGLLNTTEGPRYISMISNGSETPNTVIGQLLRRTRQEGCA